MSFMSSVSQVAIINATSTINIGHPIMSDAANVNPSQALHSHIRISNASGGATTLYVAFDQTATIASPNTNNGLYSVIGEEIYPIPPGSQYVSIYNSGAGQSFPQVSWGRAK